MATSPPAHDAPPRPGLRGWFVLHLPALLSGWFWFGMFLCGLLAPAERVAELHSGLIQEGWHLSAMAVCLGGPILVVYWLRMSASSSRPD